MMKKKFIAPVCIMVALFSVSLLSEEEAQAASETTQVSRMKLPNATEIEIETTTLNYINNYSTTVTGTALPHSIVLVGQGPNNNYLAAGLANSHGNYDISIPLQAVGTVISVQGVLNDVYSNIASTTVSSILETTTLNSLTNTSTEATGTALPNSIVLIRVGGLVIGAGQASHEGNYHVSIPVQSVGTVVTAQGLLGEVYSDVTSVTVISN